MLRERELASPTIRNWSITSNNSIYTNSTNRWESGWRSTPTTGISWSAHQEILASKVVVWLVSSPTPPATSTVAKENLVSTSWSLLNFQFELFQLTTIKVVISIITAPCMTTIIITIIVINILILKWYQYCNIILMTKYLSIILRPWSLWSWSWSHHHVEKALSIKFGINVTVVPALSFYLCCCLDCCSAIVVIGFQTGAKLFGTQLSWAQFAQNQNMNL